MSSANWGWSLGKRIPSVFVATLALGLTGCSADLTSQDGMKIGGQDAAWGGSVTLTKANAVSLSDGKCVFDIEYPVKNNGKKGAEPAFASRVRSGEEVLVEQTDQTLDAGQTTTVHGQARLSPGANSLSVMIDDGNAVSEGDEANNTFTVTVNVEGPCSEQADLAAKDAFTLGKQSGTWAGAAIALTEADAVSNTEGKCAFRLTYDLVNQGSGSATAFWARTRAGADVVTQQNDLTLNPGEERQVVTDLYLGAGPHTLELSLDDEGALGETDEANNKRTVDVTVGGTCL
jgi:subtilase family serine protease